jgi:hypothetical protein
MQRLAIVSDERRNDRNLVLAELERKGVLLENRRIRPAVGPVELRDDEAAILEPELIDTVRPSVTWPTLSTASSTTSGVRSAYGVALVIEARQRSWRIVYALDDRT